MAYTGEQMNDLLIPEKKKISTQVSVYTQLQNLYLTLDELKDWCKVSLWSSILPSQLVTFIYFAEKQMFLLLALEL